MILELKEPFDVMTPLGKAVCKFIETTTDQIFWGCFTKETGEAWWWPNPQIRLAPNLSEGRYTTSEITVPQDLKDRLAMVQGAVRSKQGG